MRFTNKSEKYRGKIDATKYAKAPKPKQSGSVMEKQGKERNRHERRKTKQDLKKYLF